MAVIVPLEDNVWVAVSAPAVVMTSSVLVMAIAISARVPIFLNAIFLSPDFPIYNISYRKC